MRKSSCCFTLVLALMLQGVHGQSYTDNLGNTYIDFTKYLDMTQFWAQTETTIADKIDPNSWYASQITTGLSAKLRMAIADVGSYNLFTEPWTMDLISPPEVNISTVNAYLASTQCKPNHFRTLIAKLKPTELEELANSSAPTSISNPATSASCKKTFVMTYFLKRTQSSLLTKDVDILLPAGLYLAPPYLIRNMPGQTLAYMMTELCKVEGSYYPAAIMPALQIRALIERLVMYAESGSIYMPSALDLCRCLPYIRRPVMAELPASFQATTTMTCFKNESKMMDFSGEFREPIHAPGQRKFMSTVYYPREPCRYSRAPMVDWIDLSKTFHKVNKTYYNIVNCFSLDRRLAYRKDNISVSWAMLNEVRHYKMSLNDREQTCLTFRGDFNTGFSYLTEQSLQMLTDGVTCLGNFEIRRIPNVYLCLISNLERFADQSRYIMDEVRWEVARKCSFYVFRTESTLPVGPAFTYLFQHWPLDTIKASTDESLRNIYGYINNYVGLMPPTHVRTYAQAISRDYNDTMFNLVVIKLCSYANVHLMSTVTFISNEAVNCTQYQALSRPQKIVAAKRIIDASPELQVSLTANNVTLALLTTYNLHHMLEALPIYVYGSIASFEILDDATYIVNTVELDTNRMKALSDAVISEFKRRAAAKYGDENSYLHEMTEPILDTLPCQLLMSVRPYEFKNIQSDMITCRTMSRRWGSCPQILLKTQTYRDYVCDVFFNCGNTPVSPDYFLDDLGVYCFCNITDKTLINMTNKQISRIIPVLSELPNCMSQLARIELTTKLIDIYPPKSYVTTLIPAGKEAWLSEIGKLACNLNAAIISERYQEETFSSQAEYLGMACCFNWTVSGNAQQRQLMAGVYFNKSTDDLWDVRKMCERMFNTTAYIVKATAAAAAESARKKRSVEVEPKIILPANDTSVEELISCSEIEDEDALPLESNCKRPDELDEMEDEETLAANSKSSLLVRNRRDIVIDGFVWTCPLLKVMTKDALYLLSVEDLRAIEHLSFIRCLKLFGSTNELSTEFYDAVLQRIKIELSRYFSFCDTSPRILEQIGYSALALHPANISCINITDQAMVALGEVELYSVQQVEAIAARYINLTMYRDENETYPFTLEHIALMGHAMCGLEDQYFDSLSDSEFESLVPMIARLKNCTYQKLSLFKERVSKSNLFGAVAQWEEEHFVELGIIAAGMSASELSSLTTTQLRWLPENALRSLVATKQIAQLTESQLKSLLQEQARIIMPLYSKDYYTLNETLSLEQRDALVIAELDDMYIPPPPGLTSGLTKMYPSFMITLFAVSFYLISVKTVFSGF